MRRFIYIIVFLLLLSSCGLLKNQPTNTIVQHDTTTVYQNNTVFQHDSVYVYKDRYIYTKGDTVYVTETSFKDRWKIKEVHDTTYIEKSKDSQEQTVVTEYVEKELTWFQKLFMALGKILSIAALLYIIYKVIRRKLL